MLETRRHWQSNTANHSPAARDRGVTTVERWGTFGEIAMNQEKDIEELHRIGGEALTMQKQAGEKKS